MRKKKKIDEEEEEIKDEEEEEMKKTSCPIVSLHDDSHSAGGEGEESELIGICSSLNGYSTITSIEPKSSEEVSVKSLTDSLNGNTFYGDTSIIDDGSVVIMGISCSNASCSDEEQHHLHHIKNSDITSSSSSSSILNEGVEDNSSSSTDGTSKRKFEAMVCSA
jgi:hypothetical protein